MRDGLEEKAGEDSTFINKIEDRRQNSQETGVSSEKLEENQKVELQITKSREPLRTTIQNRNQNCYSLLIPDLWIPLSF
jgi:hypothetical protein